MPADPMPADPTPADPRCPDEAVGSAGASGVDDRVAQLSTELESCQQRHLRTLADFDNYRRRTARELGAARGAERDRVVLAWLPVLDHLELALAHAGADPGALVDGLHGVRRLALDAVAACGVRRLDEETGMYDPARHEVGAVVNGSSSDRPAPAGAVVEVLRPGYEADGRVLRPASVAVSTGGSPAAGPRPGAP
ncbi:nucleotide exchange factor GrpE [Frankia sp. CN7]|uniref:Protein GrpE n=2 Tax=Frankia nepalensis TaxID=1836974 RepID=A0A937RBW0_9ACTN|nr:nucleotide exchange factor GrpE [Frankia nepalensis]MBL7510172.1 nucleotide exchange factor GrpE [Frankia nepalensis]MBL7626044.1 nucleotide exchange factor GrpE [Frankia nepalensis]